MRRCPHRTHTAAASLAVAIGLAVLPRAASAADDVSLQPSGPKPPASQTSAPQVDIFASFDRGAGVELANGMFGVQVGIQTLFQYDLRFHEGEISRNSFDVRNVRPVFRAHVLRPWIRLFVQPEFAGTNARLLDYELEVQPIPEIGVKVGQFCTPFSRQFTTPVPKLQFAAFSYVNDYFRGDRDIGAMAFGFLGKGRFEWYAGVFNGNGINQGGNENLEPAYFVRLATTPVGRAPKPVGHMVNDETPSLSGPVPFTFSVGVNGYLDDFQKSSQVLDPAKGILVPQLSPEERRLTGGVDVVVHYAGFTLQAEGYARRAHPEDKPWTTSAGAYLQMGQFILPKTIEIAARGNLLRTDANDPTTQVIGLEGQLGYYPLGNHLKVLGRYSLLDARSDQVGLVKGTTHALDINAQLWF